MLYEGNVKDAILGELRREEGRDASLVRRAQHGDAAAFEALAEPRIPQLTRTATAILGNSADARDAVQDACLSAWRDLPRLREAEAFDAWLGRILINACRSLVRRTRRRTVREIQLDPTSATEDLVEPLGGADAGSDPIDLDVLERAFDRLSADHRAVLVLRHLHGRSLDEIADLLRVPVGTVKSRHHAGRRALAAALEAELR
jgi:RNA polymerase sigma-70 factor (ECF subfamily)